MFRIIRVSHLSMRPLPYHYPQNRATLYLDLKTDEKFNSQSKIINEVLFYCNDWGVFDLLVAKRNTNEYIISYLHDGSLCLSNHFKLRI
jgi:hypothetical protein